MTGTDRLWQQILEQLRLQMTRATFDTWLRNSRLIDDTGDAWTAAVSNPYAADWLNHRLNLIIDRAASDVAGRPVTVTFVVSPPLAPGQVGDGPPAPQDDGTDLGIEAHQERTVTPRIGDRPLVATDFYIKLKTAFRKNALARLKGAPLSVFLCLALHVDRDGTAHPGIETIMSETGYVRGTVCAALVELADLGLIVRHDRRSARDTDIYTINGYAWFGTRPAGCPLEVPDR